MSNFIRQSTRGNGVRSGEVGGSVVTEEVEVKAEVDIWFWKRK